MRNKSIAGVALLSSLLLVGCSDTGEAEPTPEPTPVESVEAPRTDSPAPTVEPTTQVPTVPQTPTQPPLQAPRLTPSESQFLEDTEMYSNAELYFTDEQLLDLGYSLCELYDAVYVDLQTEPGASTAVVLDAQLTGTGYDEDSVQDILVITASSIDNFCPAYTQDFNSFIEKSAEYEEPLPS